MWTKTQLHPCLYFQTSNEASSAFLFREGSVPFGKHLCVEGLVQKPCLILPFIAAQKHWTHLRLDWDWTHGVSNGRLCGKNPIAGTKAIQHLKPVQSLLSDTCAHSGLLWMRVRKSKWNKPEFQKTEMQETAFGKKAIFSLEGLRWKKFLSDN